MRKLITIFTFIFVLFCQNTQAQVALDVWSNSAAEFTDDAGGTWTHTPVGTPKAVMCFVVRNAGITDSVDGVTYGGAAMTEMTGSPNIHDGAKDGVVHSFFKGSDIATGAQTVAVDVNAAVAHRAGCTTLTATANTEIVDVDATIHADGLANPSVTLSLAGRTSFVMLGAFSGQNTASNITPLTGWTSRLENDFGANNAVFYTYDTIGTTDVTAGYTAAAETAVMIAVAVSEVTASTIDCPIGGGVIC